MSSDEDRRRLAGHPSQYLAQQFVAGIGYAEFCDDPMRFYAVVRALEIVSEASRKLSLELKARYPEIPRRDVAGAGSVYRHDYAAVMQLLVWQTVFEALPALLCVVTAELS